MENLPYLIIGLGNPGRAYRQSRHNIGFMLVDRLAVRLNVSLNRLQSRALVGATVYNDQRIILAKPQTFMNLSGQPVSSLLRFYKLPLEHLLVAHDDLDLPFGALRLRPGGGSAGQKGMTSVIGRLGTQDFPRLRLGIGCPPGRMDAVDYVLEDFLTEDMPVLSDILESAADAALAFVVEGLEQAMTRYNNREIGE